MGMPHPRDEAQVFENAEGHARLFRPVAHAPGPFHGDGERLLRKEVLALRESGLRDLVVQAVGGEIIHRVDPARGNHRAVVGEDFDLRVGLKVREVLITDCEGIARDARDGRALGRAFAAPNVAERVASLARAERGDLESLHARLAQEAVTLEVRGEDAAAADDADAYHAMNLVRS